MGDTTQFGKAMRKLQSERYKLVQSQRSIWNEFRPGCVNRTTETTDDHKTFHYCSNRGKKDFRRSCAGAKLKCSYNKCPFLKAIV